MNERITTCGIVLECKKVLVAKRSVGAKTCGLWEFVGGKNRYHESEEETLIREFDEELGVKIEVGEYLDGVDFVNNDTLYHLKAYRVSLLDNSFRLSVHSEIKYVSKEELLTLEMVPSDLMLINKLIEKGLI